LEQEYMLWTERLSMTLDQQHQRLNPLGPYLTSTLDMHSTKITHNLK